MRGHIRKRGDSWAVFYDRPRDPVTGARRKTSKGGFRTRKNAERWLNDTIQKLQKGSYVETSNLTFGEYLGEWLAAARRDLRPSSLPFYEVVVERYLVPRLGAVPVQKLRPQHLSALYGELLDSGRVQREGGLSVSTVRRVHTIARKALADAVSDGLLETNPAANAKPPKAKTAEEQARKKRRFWSADDVRTYLHAIELHRLCAALHLAATTGMRRGEVLGLRWCDVDLDTARLSVQQTLVAPRYVLTFSEPKTSHGRRSIDLDPETVAVLKAHRKRQAEERLSFGPGYAESDLVFRQEDGTPVIPHLFTLAFKKSVKDAELPAIRLHDLRHTHVALLARAGVPAKVIQERVGHHSAGFTLDNYGGTFPSQHRDAAERFAALVSPAAPAGSS
jgi:integrase